MLVDLRRYTIMPGQLKAYLALYEKYGLPVQRRHVGDPLGYFISEVGTLNQVGGWDANWAQFAVLSFL